MAKNSENELDHSVVDEETSKQGMLGCTSPVASILGPLDDAPLQGFHLSTVLMTACGWIQAGWDFAMMNNIVTMLAYTKFYDRKGGMPRSYLDSLRCSLYVGTLIGQLFWGFMGDKFGRKRMFLTENIYIMVALVLCAAATWGSGEVTVRLWIAWRLLLGFGLGGEYPLAAVLTAEFSCRRWRGMLVSLVWAFQAIGYVLSALSGFLIVRAFKPGMEKCQLHQPCDALDKVWRVCMSISVIPTLAIFLLRKYLPESPRFTLFKMMNAMRAHRDVQATLAFDGDSMSTTSIDKSNGSKDGFWAYLREPGVGLKLFSCMSSWFLRDVTFITIMLWGGAILNKGFGKVVKVKPGHIPGHTVYEFWYHIFLGWTLFYMATNVTGYFLGVALIDVVGRKTLQGAGFFLSGVLMAVAAIMEDSMDPKVFAVVLMLALLVANAGPNLTVFVVPAELFKTKFRCRCHSMAAASGRVGALVSFLVMDRLMQYEGPSKTLGALAAVSLLGIFTTLLIPETMNRSLEELSGDTMEEDAATDSMSTTVAEVPTGVMKCT